MIEVKAIVDNSWLSVPCPCCAVELLHVLPDSIELPSGGMYDDGDSIPVAQDLPLVERDGCGWSAVLVAGSCPKCEKPLFGITIKFTDALPDDDIENTFFHDNDDKGDACWFGLSDGKLSWIAARFDTPIGPMAEHVFGPFADSYGDWIGENGVSACRGSGQWDFATYFVLERWSALRSLSKGMGLHTTDPLAQSRPLPPEGCVRTGAAFQASHCRCGAECRPVFADGLEP